MSTSVAADKSRAACEALLTVAEYRDAGVIMLYAPIPQELDVEPVARSAWDRGKTVLAPRVDTQRHCMEVAAIRSLDDLTPRYFGIREPAGGEPWPVERIDLVIVPGVAFDRTGNRLGRGGGYYDRFLAQPGLDAVACGLAFAEQVLGEIPVRAYDRPVDMLVTDEGVLRFQ